MGATITIVATGTLTVDGHVTALGDYVLVHAGFAITVIDAEEALRTLAYLAEFDPEELT